jgi:hypothetical protein
VQRNDSGYAAIRLATSDLTGARDVWRAQGVQAIDLSPEVSLIPAAQANGVALMFQQR